MGTGARAGAANSTAIGVNSSVDDSANNGTAIGTNSVVQAGHTNSTAIGFGAQSEFTNEVSLGAKNGSQTYTTPGITSGLSKSRQTVGPLEVVTSDQAGHLATNGGSIFEALDELESGVALAISMENPDLIAGEQFGIAFNAGFYEGAQAVSVAAQGVMGYNIFSEGDRVTFSGGIGVGLDNGRGDTTVGGRVGGQITWR